MTRYDSLRVFITPHYDSLRLPHDDSLRFLASLYDSRRLFTTVYDCLWPFTTRFLASLYDASLVFITPHYDSLRLPHNDSLRLFMVLYGCLQLFMTILCKGKEAYLEELLLSHRASPCTSVIFSVKQNVQ